MEFSYNVESVNTKNSSVSYAPSLSLEITDRKQFYDCAFVPFSIRWKKIETQIQTCEKHETKFHISFFFLQFPKLYYNL